MINLNLRTAGVLLHITSLPNPYGVGDLGAHAYRFVDWLSAAGQSIWQLLPTNPIGPCDSPYQSVSAFAGSPLMVALEPLIEKGWLTAPQLLAEGFDVARVRYEQVVPWRIKQLRVAAVGFEKMADASSQAAFTQWCESQAHWLDNYALFMALEAAHEGKPWWQWAAPLAKYEAAALLEARRVHEAEIKFWSFVQWCFDVQMRALKRYANEKGVYLMGDLPIFIAHHSADCWARPDLYYLDENNQPTVIAGVPPDNFSPTGQRWGNPLYRWDKMASENFAWWTDRLRRALGQADIFRIDHFRGFAAYWEVPASCPTAIEGRWVTGPGKALFAAIEKELGKLPILAEDLGLITPDVLDLRDSFAYPGMRILQSAFGGDASNEFLPHHYVRNTAVYTGTHDNDTVLGWWDKASEHEKRYASAYLEVERSDIHWAMIRTAYQSIANIAICQMQDAMGLGGAHRMNLPGTTENNWVWRFSWDMLQATIAPKLARLTAATGRGTFQPLVD